MIYVWTCSQVSLSSKKKCYDLKRWSTLKRVTICQCSFHQEWSLICMVFTHWICITYFVLFPEALIINSLVMDYLPAWFSLNIYFVTFCISRCHFSLTGTLIFTIPCITRSCRNWHVMFYFSLILLSGSFQLKTAKKFPKMFSAGGYAQYSLLLIWVMNLRFQ
jgi:hypothetical protein